MNRDPVKADILIRDSLRLDPSNRSASEALASLTANIQAAKTIVDAALALIEKGEIDGAAAARLRSVDLYKPSLAAYHQAEERLETSRKAVAAQTLFREGDAIKAIELVTQAEQSYSSEFTRSISKQIRHDVSEDRLRSAMSLPSETPLQRMHRIRALERAVQIDPTNPHAMSLLPVSGVNFEDSSQKWPSKWHRSSKRLAASAVSLSTRRRILSAGQ